MRKNKAGNWTDYDEGYTIGTSGMDDGAVVRDEEHDAGARLTLEEDGSSAPFTLTCGVYGWLTHARFFEEETEADEAFNEMKTELEEILESMPDERAAEEEREDFAEELAAFIEKYP